MFICCIWMNSFVIHVVQLLHVNWCNNYVTYSMSICLYEMYSNYRISELYTSSIFLNNVNKYLIIVMSWFPTCILCIGESWFFYWGVGEGCGISLDSRNILVLGCHEIISNQCKSGVGVIFIHFQLCLQNHLINFDETW